MTLPKALLCLVGDTVGDSQEANLRAAGFATTTIRWREVTALRFGWMHLADILDDPSFCAWILAGEPDECIPELLAQTRLLMLALRRLQPPILAFVPRRRAFPALPVLRNHALVFAPGEAFAGRLMAARFKPTQIPPQPCHLKTHLNPLAGLWLEIGPARGEAWDGFMVGTLAAKVTAFGVGPRGTIPRRTSLAHPLCGIRGDVAGMPFEACAAKNPVSEETACFVLVQGIPHGIFIGGYPEGENNETRIRIDFVM